MKIAIYLSSVPPKVKNEQKINALKRFGKGVESNGDSVQFVTDTRVVDSDVSVIQGFVSNDFTSSHLRLRKEVVDRSQSAIIIDSNLFQFSCTEDPSFYLRYSVNGVFPTTGFYFDNKIDSSRWAKISNRLNLQLADYRENGDHVLISLQRMQGWSMRNIDVQTWLDECISKIRMFSDRKIVVRKHPGDKKQHELRIKFNDVVFSENPLLVTDLKNCWANVTFNSSPGVASLIKGIPTFVTDPSPCHSQTYPICNTDISLIETPALYDRQPWIERLCQFHWNNDEVASGEAWEFMKERLVLFNKNK